MLRDVAAPVWVNKASALQFPIQSVLTRSVAVRQTRYANGAACLGVSAGSQFQTDARPGGLRKLFGAADSARAHPSDHAARQCL